MSRETEKLFRDLQGFLDKQGAVDSDEELNRLVEGFMKDYNMNLGRVEKVTPATAKTADDYLELAEQAQNKESAMRYARKALKLEPDNLDAELLIALIGTDDMLDALKRVERIIEKGNKWLEKEGYFEEDTGHFWGIIETRPYMRLRQNYLEMLLDLGMFDKAASEAEDMIRLNENDNLGIRHTLMHLYALLGDEEKALALLEQYDEDSVMMQMPLAVLYFKKHDFKKAEERLRIIMKRNPDLKKFLRTVVNGDAPEEGFQMPGAYRPFSMEEIVVCLDENEFLYEAVPGFVMWAAKTLLPERSNSKKTKRK